MGSSADVDTAKARRAKPRFEAGAPLANPLERASQLVNFLVTSLAVNLATEKARNPAMSIITIASSKGGAGKTTIARLLLGHAVRNGADRRGARCRP